MSGSIACAPRWQKDCWMTNSHLNLPTTSVSSNIDSWWASLCSLKYALSYVMKTICGYKSVWAIVDFCSYPQFFFQFYSNDTGLLWGDGSIKISKGHLINFSAANWLWFWHSWLILTHWSNYIESFPENVQKRCHESLWTRTITITLTRQAKDNHGWVWGTQISGMQG